MELERSEDIFIVTHQAVLRCIYAYFMQKDQVDSPWMAVPLHTLIKLTPRAYGTQEERFKANIPAVSTWRAKGSVAKHEDPIEGDTVCMGGETFRGQDINASTLNVNGLKIDASESVVATAGKENDAPKAETPSKAKD